jgi:hypothetical protein
MLEMCKQNNNNNNNNNTSNNERPLSTRDVVSRYIVTAKLLYQQLNHKRYSVQLLTLLCEYNNVLCKRVAFVYVLFVYRSIIRERYFFFFFYTK